MIGVEYNKNKFRMMLKRIKEDGELDSLIKDFVYYIKKHEIYLEPSKGKEGEDGKDITAIEDRERLTYCSYVIKAGHLNRKNLDGKYGILKQMRDAMEKELRDRKYLGKKRTAVVVHNGWVTNRAFLYRFTEEKERLEDEAEAKGLLLRSIERWDLNRIVEEIFPYAEDLAVFEMQSAMEEKQCQQERINEEFIEEIENLSEHSPSSSIEKVAMKYYEKIKKINWIFQLNFPK